MLFHYNKSLDYDKYSAYPNSDSLTMNFKLLFIMKNNIISENLICLLKDNLKDNKTKSSEIYKEYLKLILFSIFYTFNLFSNLIVQKIINYFLSN